MFLFIAFQTNKNGTIEIPYALFDGMSYTPADEFLSFDESELTGEQDYLLVYANNSLGEHFVANISILSIPTTTPGKKTKNKDLLIFLKIIAYFLKVHLLPNLPKNQRVSKYIYSRFILLIIMC